MAIHNIIEAMTTGATCGEACWCAREDICRCSCGGKNHGIMRTPDGVKPERTSHKHGKVYKLVCVTDYNEAFNIVNGDYGAFLDKYHYTKTYPHERMLYNRVTDSQLKWREVDNMPQTMVHENLYLVWERMDTPRDW